MIIWIIFILVLLIIILYVFVPNLNRYILIGGLVCVALLIVIVLIRERSTSGNERLMMIRNENLRQEVINQLLLTVDHLTHPDRQCYECMIKHLVLAEALAELETTKSMSDEISGVASDIRRSILNLRQRGATPEIVVEIENIIKHISQLKSVRASKPKTDRALLPLRNTFFNLREILKQIELIEHAISLRYSKDYILNVIQFARSLAQEGATMSTEQREAYITIDQWLKDEIQKIELKTDIDPTISQDFRKFRKDINTFYPSLHEKALLGDNADEPKFKTQCSTICQEK